MGKEIKFRAWLSGKHGNLTFFKSEMQYNAPVIEGKWADIESGWDIHGLYDTVPLMQYTGLKDKNGKEIYESDIVVLKNKTIFDLNQRKSTAIIIYDNDNARFWIESDTIDTKYFTMQSLSDFEIVGNIFENPDLLKA